jgi:hypothetical protein
MNWNVRQLLIQYLDKWREVQRAYFEFRFDEGFQGNWCTLRIPVLSAGAEMLLNSLARVRLAKNICLGLDQSLKTRCVTQPASSSVPRRHSKVSGFR